MQIISKPLVKDLPEKHMGKITTEITVTNNEDLILRKADVISDEEVRSVRVPNVLIDTGATTLCLPQKYINQLGLSDVRTVAVKTATGVSEAHIYQNVKLQLGAREAIVECVELPDEADPLLGVIPLEMMGIELDLQKQQIKFLPFDMLDTYITVY